nr:MAG TPA: Thymidylate synthase complementing protein [Caudoviricetes sp.]
MWKNRITINVRDYLTQGGKLKDLKEFSFADDYMTVKFTVDIGVARELIRHRQMSFMERSTRYCNMFDDIELIKPVSFAWAESGELNEAWYMECVSAEAAYRLMIRKGARPQEARTVLPLSTATVLYVTGMYKQWEDMLKLRLAPGAHPQMRYIMQKLVELEDFPKNKIKVPEFEHSEKKN